MINKVQDKKVIIQTDGGICSQIYFCAFGYYLEDLGYKVKYDLSWFKKYGHDCINKFVRNYSMELAFPNLKFEIATDDEIENLKTIQIIANDIPKNNKSAYLYGYPKERETAIVKYKEKFIKNFKPIGIDDCSDILKEIKQNNSCAVHVRLGDLAVYNPSYGYPTPKEYYIKAINIINRLYPNTKFFFFSEECNWIKKEIIPNCDIINYQICDKNGSDKGYLDLYLMTKCDYFITSSGSLAKLAKILSNNNGTIILDRYDKNIVENFENSIILNDTILINKKFENNNTTILPKQETIKKLSVLEKIFSITKSNDKNHKILTIFGIKIKVKIKKK